MRALILLTVLAVATLTLNEAFADNSNVLQVDSKKIYYLLKKATSKVVYGKDDRVEVKDQLDKKLIALAASTAAMMNPEHIKILSDGSAILGGKTLIESLGACELEKFSQQKAAALCSGFLVGPDLLVTAGHCADTGVVGNFKDYVWVFDYVADKNNNSPTSAPKKNVYRAVELIEQVYEDEKFSDPRDYALIRLDRKVEGRTHLKIRTSGRPLVGTPLILIGNPMGLPTKIAANASLKNNSPKNYFQTNTDSYKGNSGSAVFNAKTLTVEGILVRGETDYEYTDNMCAISNVCKDDMSDCQGESVQRITLLPKLKKLYKAPK